MDSNNPIDFNNRQCYLVHKKVVKKEQRLLTYMYKLKFIIWRIKQ